MYNRAWCRARNEESRDHRMIPMKVVVMAMAMIVPVRMLVARIRVIVDVRFWRSRIERDCSDEHSACPRKRDQDVARREMLPETERSDDESAQLQPNGVWAP